MSAQKVKKTIDAATEFTSFHHSRVLHRPWMLSDNDPCYVWKALKEYLEQEGIAHTPDRPYHPMTQGKIERYHEAQNNLTPDDVYYRRGRKILSRRKKIKKITMLQRRRYNCSLEIA